MKTTIDNFSSTTGWTTGLGAAVHGVNQVPEYVAGLNSQSLVFSFNGLGGWAEKSIAMDISKYEEVTFHLWSRNKKKAGWDFQLSADFVYKIDFGTGVEYLVPTFQGFMPVTLDISALTTPITRVRITALHPDTDYLIVSEMVAVRDEIPADLFIGIKEHVDNAMAEEYGRTKFKNSAGDWIEGVASKGIPIGIVSGNAGDSDILFTGPLPFVEKYSVIRIDDGVNSEVHQVMDNDELEFHFNTNYDGSALVNTFVSAVVYLVLPCVFGTSESEITLPGIALSGMASEEVQETNKEDTVRDTFTPGDSVKSRQTSVPYQYRVFFDCNSRHDSVLAMMSKVVRAILSKEFVWVNGKKIEIAAEGPGEYFGPDSELPIIPKIQLRALCEIREEVWRREDLVKTLTNTRNFNILEQ